MANEDAVKSVLVLAHAMMDKLQNDGDVVESYWSQAKDLHPEDPDREVLLVKMDALSKKAVDLLPKAAALLSALSASQEDLHERNAVLMNAFKTLSEAAVKLYRMHECVLDISG